MTETTANAEPTEDRTCICGFVAMSKKGLGPHRRFCKVHQKRTTPEAETDEGHAAREAMRDMGDAYLEMGRDTRLDQRRRFKRTPPPAPASIEADEHQRILIGTVCRFALEMGWGRPALNEASGARTWVSPRGPVIQLDHAGGLHLITATTGPRLEI